MRHRLTRIIELDRSTHIGHVQKRRLFQTDVNECSLHSGQHSLDRALNDHAHQTDLACPLNPYLGEHAVFDCCNPGFLRSHIDQEFFCHVTLLVHNRYWLFQGCGLGFNFLPG